MGDYATGLRRVALMRGVARFLLPAAGGIVGVALWAGAAQATVDSIQYTGPTSPTTVDTLDWTVAGTSGDTLECTLLIDGTAAGAPVDCSAGTFSAAATTAGSYVLEGVDTTDGTPATDSAPVTVTNPPLPAPAAPTPSAPASPANDTSPTWTLGLPADSADGTCTVTDAGSTVVAGPATCSGASWTSDLGSGATSGDYTLSVVANGDGISTSGQSAPGTAVYTLDITPPGTLTVTAPSSPGSSRHPSFTVAEAAPAAASLTCTLTLPDSSIVSIACSVGTVTPTLSGADGLYTLTVAADDGLGNTTTGSADYTLDTGAPTTPTVSRSSPVGNTTTPSFTVSNVDADASVSCDVSPGATVTSCSKTAVTISISGGEGDYVVSVTATDAAHNTSTGTFTYTLDTTLPSQPTVGRTPALDNTRTPSFAVGSVDADATVTCHVTGTATVTACTKTGVTVSITGADGDYTVSVTASDPAGNSNTGTFIYSLDTTPPTKPTISRSTSVDHNPTPSFTVGEPDGDATVTCGVSTGATVTACSATGVAITITGVDGDYVVTVTATDPLGNAISTTYTYTLDRSPPTTPTVSRTPAVDNTRTPAFTVSSVDANASVTCSVSPGAVVTACSSTGVTINITGADGDYVVSVTATDPAGNTSTGTFTYTLDTAPPPGPTVSTPPALTNSNTVTLTISDAEVTATLTCKLTDPAGHLVSNGQCPANGTFDTTGHPDGTYTLVVTANDHAGNKSTTTVTWVLDTTPPPPPTVSAPPNPTNLTAVQLTIGDSEGTAALTCVLTGPGGGTVSSGACPANGTFDTTGHGDGIYTLVVTATDLAGNTSSTTVSWTRDQVPPAQPTVTAPASPSRSRAPSFTVSDTDAVARWQCTVSGPSSVTITACGPTTTLNLTGALDGVYTVSVVAFDAAGNASSAGSATYTFDTTPPPPPSVAAPQSPTKVNSVGLTISDSESDAVLTCVLTAPGGATVTSGPCPGSFDTTGFSDGTYTLVVTATDPAGNSASTTVSWVRDTVPPPAPTVSAPTSPSKVSSPTFTVTDTEAGVTFTCTVTGPSVVAAGCGPTTTINLVGAADGTYTLSVTATDAAGNVSIVGTATYLFDTTPPASPGVSVTASPSQGRHPSFSVSGIETNGVTTCTLSGPAGSTVTVARVCGTTVPVDLTGQPDGTYTLIVTVTDQAGNVSQVGGASYTLDTTPPVAPIVAAPVSPGNDRTPTLNIVAEPGATLTCTIDRYFQQVSTGPCPADGTLDLAGYDDGEFEITVTATDAAGNVSAETTVVYVLDTTPPPAPVLTEPASPSPIEKPVWLFTAEDGTTATCTVTGPAGQVVQGPQPCSSPYMAVLKGLPDGAYTLTVVVTDAAGNVSVAARSVFILDRQAPVPPTVTPPHSPGTSRSPQWLITTPKGATLTCTLLRGGTVVDGPGACPADGTYSLAGMPDGVYTLRVTATDSAGNVSATSVTTYVLDTFRPPTPRLDYSAPSPSLSEKPYWGFTLPAGTTGRCELLHNGALIDAKSDCKGAVSFDLTGRPVGTYTVRIVAVDAAGNESRALYASYVLGVPSSGGFPSTGGSGGTSSSGPTVQPKHRPPLTQPSAPSTVQQVLQRANALAADAGAAGKKVVATVKHVASAILPDFHDKVTEHVSKAVQGVVNAVTHAGGGTGFPLLLLIIVLGFLLVQNRIDRRDPKLALASVAADDTIEFRPPPSQRS